MIGDKWVFTNRQKVIASRIAKKLIDMPTPENGLYTISIGGGSGTGKTEIARITQERLIADGIKSLVISLDDYYVVRPEDRNESRLRLGVECVGLDEIFWEKLYRIIEAFKGRMAFSLDEYNRFSRAYQQILFPIDKIDVLIIEGLYANNINSDLNIHLDANPDLTFDFRQKRAKECEVNDFRRKVVEQEYKIVNELVNKVNPVVYSYDGVEL